MTLAVGTVCAATMGCFAAGSIELQGTEFPITVRYPGDQVNARLALDATGGLVVWQDAAIDGQGLGIAALRLNETLSPQSGGAFQVNENAAGDQENARLTLLPNGGTFIVWQGGEGGFPHIHGRLLGADGTFDTGDIPISTGGEHQTGPEVATLSDGRVVVVWASYRQDGPNYDVFARLFSSSGEPLGTEFRVNAGLGLGRRSPTVAPLQGGGFLVAWIGERVTGQRDNLDVSGQPVPGAGAPIFEVALYTRVFDATGQPASGDNRVAGMDAMAAHPAVASLPGGNLVLAWTRRDPTSTSNHLDIASMVLTPAGLPDGPERLLNAQLYGDQYRPSLAVTPAGVLVVWSSMGQDGSWEGVYGRWLNADGLPAGDEMRLNTTIAGGQILPAVAGNAAGKVLAVWSMNLPQSGLELFGQRLAADAGLPAPSAPFIVPLSSSSLMVSWAPVGGLDVAGYRVYGDTGNQLAEVTDPFWTLDDLAPATSLSARIGYVLASGEVSPLSPAGTGKTWGADKNFDGLPDEWQAAHWPEGHYPAGTEDSDGDGVRNVDEWLAGTDPMDPTSNLRVSGQSTPLGIRLEWPTQKGFVYQLQLSADGETWAQVGGPRFAAGATDSVTIPATGQVALYRVLRVR